MLGPNSNIVGGCVGRQVDVFDGPTDFCWEIILSIDPDGARIEYNDIIIGNYFS